MTAARYQEALASGLNRREAGFVAAAGELAAIFREAREREERFARSLATTRAALQATPPEKRAALNARFLAWRAAEESG